MQYKEKIQQNETTNWFKMKLRHIHQQNIQLLAIQKTNTKPNTSTIHFLFTLVSTSKTSF